MPPDSSSAFLPPRSALSALIRRVDWAATPLGPLTQWPPHLRTAVGLVLHSPKPMTLLWGEEGTMVYNDAYAVIAGGRHPACLGQSVFTAWPEVAEFNARLMQTVLGGQPQSFIDYPFTFLRNGTPEEVWLALDYSPVPDDDGAMAGVLAVVTETTDKIVAERALRHANETLEAHVQERTRELLRVEEALRQSQKMEAIGQLTGGIAHDFNNLLQVMVGHLDLLDALRRAGKADAACLGRSVETIRGAVTKASTLTQQLLAFARKQRLEGRTVNLNTLVEGLIAMVKQTLGEPIQLGLDLDPALGNCRLDATQLEVAILNVLVNARDAMPAGGVITITTANVRVDVDDTPALAGLRPGPYVSLAVSDTGSGIPEEILGQVMDPFFTTKEEGKGTGLGLSMVYGFAKQSGGTIVIQSDCTVGTTVQMYFPRADGDATPGVAPDAAPAERGGHETILVVDDRAEVAALARDMLQSLGYTVLTACNAQEALDASRDGGRPGRPDLLLSDVVMPGGMDGFVLARELCDRLPGLRVLLMTGYAGTSEARHGGGAAFDVIAKPFRLVDLARKVRAVLDATTG